MKALFLAENYHWFYNRYWETHPEIRELDFATCCRRMFDEFFYQSDSHAAGLRCLGHEAITLVPDCIPLQLKWAREHGLWMPPYRRESLPFPDRLVRLATGSVIKPLSTRCATVFQASLACSYCGMSACSSSVVGSALYRSQRS